MVAGGRLPTSTVSLNFFMIGTLIWCG